MTRRNFILRMLTLAAAASIANTAVLRIFTSEKLIPEAKDSNIVMQSGWILLDSDQ